MLKSKLYYISKTLSLKCSAYKLQQASELPGSDAAPQNLDLLDCFAQTQRWQENKSASSSHIIVTKMCSSLCLNVFGMSLPLLVH